MFISVCNPKSMGSTPSRTRGLVDLHDGGLGFFIKHGLDPSVAPTKTCTTFENFLKISLHKESFYFLNIYRLPSSSIPTFFEQFQSLLEDIHHIKENLVIIGGFNFLT